MRKLVNVIQSEKMVIKVYESPYKLRAEVFCMKSNKPISKADFLYVDGDMSIERVKEYYGLTSENSFEVQFTRKNGKIVYGPFIDPNRRIIWSNNELEEDEEDSGLWLADERANLDVEVNGYIVAYAVLGLWDGAREASKLIGTNVSDILYSNCEYVTWFCDRYDVRCEAIHHDGTNRYLYRVAETKEKAEKLAYEIAYGEMGEKEFRKATKSLRPYIAKEYGW